MVCEQGLVDMVLVKLELKERLHVSQNPSEEIPIGGTNLGGEAVEDVRKEQ